ncbi:regulator of DNA class I crossover intermediates 1 [Microcaecilia unicolor]|uniref:Uncharacterized protein C12orf40 homolog n=1 Tax=Microcaecilia unicolor TaxID=1415580 RepID=A0A6P7ZB47_9AMPH|nr:uncharacterized protein C12orf40 homolog [Microcaecilia unicolor]
MNWVGGSRTRIMLKQERRRQKEFFEKKKLKSKMEMLEESISPTKNNSVSLDLLNLYVVNQISMKKERNSILSKAVHVNMNKGTTVPLRKCNVNLSMSPSTIPLKICLDYTQNCMQQQRKTNKMKHLSESIRNELLLPVIESNCNSSMEYQYSTGENYATCLNSSASWPSNCKQTPGLVARTHLLNSPWELLCEEKQNSQFASFSQFGGGVSEDSWVFASKHKHINNQADMRKFGSLFDQSNSGLGNLNITDKTHIMNIGKDSGTTTREEPFFYSTVQCDQPEFVLSENKNQLIHDVPSENDGPFVNFSNPLFMRNKDTDMTSNSCGLHDAQDLYDQNYNDEGCLGSGLAISERVLFKDTNILRNTASKQVYDNSLEKHNSQNENLYKTFFQKQQVHFSRSEASTNEDQKEIYLEENTQFNSLIAHENIHVKKTSYRPSQGFDFQEIPVTEQEVRNFEMNSEAAKKINCN